MATRDLTIPEHLHNFVQRWHDYHSTEMAGAQSYLNHLLECYGAEFEPGELFEQHPVRVIKPQQNGLFGGDQVVTTSDRMDMYIPRICVWEMKGPDEDLSRHYDQVLRYWVQTRPRYMVLCNFHEIWIYDTDEPDGLYNAHKIKLTELTDRYEALLFLCGGEAYFAQKSERVTREAAQFIGQAVRELIEASHDRTRDRERITKFALECVFAMFAEDTGLVPGKLFENAMRTAQATGDLSPVYTLFDDFGREQEYDRSNVLAPYINGPLYDREHPKLRIDRSIVSVIFEASKQDWTAVRPEIFGSIFEQAIDQAKRHELGAHFTAEADIMKVVGPTVVRPWRERIKACKTHKDCEKLIERMKNYHVLDPACGSGNFLYVAYREMKRLERALMNRWEERYNSKYARRKVDRRNAPPGPYFTINQLHGIDKDEIAVQLTRVVLWIGRHLASRENDTDEASLPLTNISGNIIKADALFTDWFRPPDDGVSELAIVGNPPFMGRHKMRHEMGDEYVDKLHIMYTNNRNADYVTYWYARALKTLRQSEHAGFVSTNSIAQNESREASLDRIIESGGTITDAWKSYAWPGEAAVHVGIVNWTMIEFSGSMYLHGDLVDRISSQLSSDTDTTQVSSIEQNQNLCFKGVEPGSDAFIIDGEERNRIIEMDAKSKDVIVPFIDGRDLNRTIDQSASRWIINITDFSLDQAAIFKGALYYLREHVYPTKMMNERKTVLEKKQWWKYRRDVVSMRQAIDALPAFLVCPHVSPHVLLSFLTTPILPSNLIEVITLNAYYHFGILQSAIHEYWAWARGSTLEERLRYTNTTIFETFPFPLLPDGGYDPRQVPDTPEAERVSRVAEELYAKRQAACKTLNLGLTKIYNYIKGKTPLTNLSVDHQALITELIAMHEQLNAAVCACYGWPEDTWRDENEVLKRLLELNLALTADAMPLEA